MELNNYEKIVDLYKKMGEPKDQLQVFYANDYPIPYKTLTLYPVQVDLNYYFNLFVTCLLLPHKTSGDVKAISLSYLKYIYYLATEKKDKSPLFFLGELLLIVLRKDSKYIDKNGIEQSTIDFYLDKGTFTVEGETFNSKDFDKIKSIILEQNDVDELDETIPPALLQAYLEKEEFLRRQNNFKMCSFEDRINVVVSKSSYKRDEILKMTIRSFTRLLERINLISDYEIKSLLAPNMDEKGRKTITHYLANTEKSLKEKCNESFTDLGELEKKINS